MAIKRNGKSQLLVPRCAYRKHAGPLLLYSVVHWDVSSVGDVVGLDVFVGNLFIAVEVEDGQLFLINHQMLLRHGNPCPDGWMDGTIS